MAPIRSFARQRIGLMHEGEIKMRRLILFFFLLAHLFNFAPEADGKCTKPKIYVRVALVEGTERVLNSGSAFRTNDMWLDEIMSQTVEELRLQAGGEIDIIPHEKAVFTDDNPETPRAENAFNEEVDGEYSFSLKLGASMQRNFSGVPDDSLPPVFSVYSSLRDADPGGHVLGDFVFDHPDLSAAIRSNIFRLCGRGLVPLVREYENTHFNALRDASFWPRLLNPGFVSPEPGERTVTITVNTWDCRSRSGKGTYVWVEKETDRGETRITKGTYPYLPFGKYRRAQTAEDGRAGIEFKLKNGTEAGFQELEVFLIGRGRKKTEKTIKIPVKGLKLEVAPDRNSVHPGGEAEIAVRLVKVDPQDKFDEEPLEGRRVSIAARGLVNGSLEPGEALTDADGRAYFLYRAGNLDRRVIFNASYRPQDYPDSAEGEAAVKVSVPTAAGTVVYRRNNVIDELATEQAGGIVISSAWKGYLEEDASVKVFMRYTHSYGGKDYYESFNESGSYAYSCRIDFFKNGLKTAGLCDEHKEAGALGPDDVAVKLTLDRETGEYELYHLDINSPDNGLNGCWVTDYRVHLGLFPEVKGVVREGAVKGSISNPPRGTGLPDRYDWGHSPGTSFSWDLVLPPRE